MARSAIPDFGIEYPEYEYRPFPKYVGMTADGEALIAKDKTELEELKELAVYPKVLGKDKHGNEIIAQNPRDEEWLAGKVAKPSVPEANALTGEEVRRGPGRPAKVA